MLCSILIMLFFVLLQVCSHLSHEANTERLFSLAGNLSDSNGKMAPDRLAIWTSVGANLSVYKPTNEAVCNLYWEKFSALDLAEDETAYE